MQATQITASHLPVSSPWARAFTFVKGFADDARQHAHSNPMCRGDDRTSAFPADLAPTGFSKPATIFDDGADYQLRQHAVLRFAEPQGHCFTCLAGAVFLTVDHEGRGLVLEAGETYHCADTSTVIVSALQAARLSVCPAA